MPFVAAAQFHSDLNNFTYDDILEVLGNLECGIPNCDYSIMLSKNTLIITGVIRKRQEFSYGILLL